jgi:tetratricopeptide (TPR) repeat protein
MDDNTHDLQEALTLAEKACRLTSYQNPIVLITLAMAYRDLRLFDKAIDTAEKARELSSSMRDDKLTAVIRSLLESCVEKRPVVDEAGR